MSETALAPIEQPSVPATEAAAPDQPKPTPKQPPRPATARVTSQQKAAIVIAMLGDDARPVIEKMDEAHLKTFVTSYAELKKVPRPILLQIVQEFVQEVRGSFGSIAGSTEAAQEILSTLLDEDMLDRVLGDRDIEEDTDAGPTVWERLSEVDAEEFAPWLAEQRSQFVAIIISRLSAEKAGQVMAELPDEISQKIILRLTQPINIDETTVDVIARVVESQYFASQNAGSGDAEAVDLVTAIMNFLPSDTRDALMSFVEDKKPETATAIKRNLLTFEDLPERLPRNAVPIVFREMDEPTLLTALKYGEDTAPGTVEYLFGNISQRMAENMKEQIAEMSAPAKKEAEAAQTAMMVQIGNLARDETITLLAPAPDSTETF